MTDSFIFGSKIKSTPDGKISGWLVRFSDGDKVDIQGEYFTKDTDFGELSRDGVNSMKSVVLYQHGLDAVMKKSVNIVGTLKMFDEGVWIDSQLDLADRYQKAVYKILPKLGWSAGAPARLVETKKKSNGAHEITRFPLGADASMTPTPVEPTTIPSILDVVAMKSLPATGIEALLEGGETASNTIAVDNLTITTKGITIMAEQETQETQETPPVAKTPEEPKELKALELRVAEGEAKIKGWMEMIENSDKLKDLGFIAPDSEEDHDKTKSLGDFLIAVKNGNEKRIKSVYKSQIEASGPDGGYTVPEQFLPKIYEVMKQDSGILQRVTMQPVSSPTGKYPALDQYITPTAGVGTSAFDGGMTGVARTEGGSYTEDDVDFTMIEWKVNDAVSGMVKVSRELSQDAPIIEATLTRLIAQVQRTKTEYFVLRGSGVNQPTGILNSAAAIGLAPATNDTFAYVDALNMISRFLPVGGQPAWLAHRSTLPDIGNMESSSGGAVWQANYQQGLGSTLLGYPILFSEHLPQANNPGHIILADMSAYVLFNLGGMYVDFSEHFFFGTGYNAWRFGNRMDGKLQLQKAITDASPQGSYTQSPIVYFNDPA